METLGSQDSKFTDEFTDKFTDKFTGEFTDELDWSYVINIMEQLGSQDD